MRQTKLLLLITLCFTHSLQATTDTWHANNDGTVTDVATTLMWQQEEDGVRRSRDDAITYCSDLSLAGYRDWRLPTIKELASIIDHRTHVPALDLTAFILNSSPSSSDDHWSSTVRLSANLNQPMTVDFGTGNVDGGFFSRMNFVFCVR